MNAAVQACRKLIDEDILENWGDYQKTGQRKDHEEYDGGQRYFLCMLRRQRIPDLGDPLCHRLPFRRKRPCPLAFPPLS
jgi:hypothetical protein